MHIANGWGWKELCFCFCFPNSQKKFHTTIHWIFVQFPHQCDVLLYSSWICICTLYLLMKSHTLPIFPCTFLKMFINSLVLVVTVSGVCVCVCWRCIICMRVVCMYMGCVYVKRVLCVCDVYVVYVYVCVCDVYVCVCSVHIYGMYICVVCVCKICDESVRIQMALIGELAESVSNVHF